MKLVGELPVSLNEIARLSRAGRRALLGSLEIVSRKEWVGQMDSLDWRMYHGNVRHTGALADGLVR